MSTSGNRTFISLSEYDSWGEVEVNLSRIYSLITKFKSIYPLKVSPANQWNIFTYLSHLDTCSQQLLLLRTHQTQTAPSSVCGGDS